MKTPHEILKKYWGFHSFRPLQEDIIQSVLAGNDTLGLMPTGGGKSVTFQVPGMMLAVAAIANSGPEIENQCSAIVPASRMARLQHS